MPQTASAAMRFLAATSDVLQAPPPALATAAVYLHRLDDAAASDPHLAAIDAHMLAATCLHIACKHTETPRKLRDILNAAHLCLPRPVFGGNDSNDKDSHKDSHKDSRHAAATLALSDDRFWSLKTSLVRAEHVVLRALGYDVAVRLPYAHLARVLRAMAGAQAEAEAAYEPPGALSQMAQVAQVAVVLVGDVLLVDAQMARGLANGGQRRVQRGADAGLVLALAAVWVAVDAVGLDPPGSFVEWCTDWGDAATPALVAGARLSDCARL
ncbi:cyclin-like protein [Entophlyctis helioformis]|nr:cyclin-like protein [Entophlyctis helioformis]